MSVIKKKINIIGFHSQEGAALVIAVMILLVLTVIGIYAITTSTFETKIAGFEREFKEAFYTADSGEPIGIDIIKTIIHYLPSDRNELPDPWKTTGFINEDLFKTDTDQEIFTDERNSDEAETAPDMNFVGSDIGFPSSSPTRLKADIDRLASYQITGGAQQFAAGYEGIGSGGGGSVGIIYAIDSVGQYTYTNAQSKIEAGYRYVVGVAGGH